MHCFADDWLPLIPGAVWAGPHPAGRTRIQTLRRCGELLHHGVRAVADLTLSGEGAEYEALLQQAALEEKAFVRRERLPMAPDAAPDPAALNAVLAALTPHWRAGQVVYVHAGEVDARVVLFAACAAQLLRRWCEEAALLDDLPLELRRFVGERSR